MAIRSSKEERYLVEGNMADMKIRCERALSLGGFTNIIFNPVIHQFTADYKKLTVWGSIIVTLTAEGNGISILANSTANSDNIFALFSSPNVKILSQFKNHLS